MSSGRECPLLGLLVWCRGWSVEAGVTTSAGELVVVAGVVDNPAGVSAVAALLIVTVMFIVLVREECKRP
jgi:hypothetical protein